MPNITKQCLLRTGDLDFTATTASDSDQYLVTVDERVDKGTVAELFVAVPSNPVPRGTIKQLGGGYLICDSIRCSARSGFIWHVEVTWKEIESDEPQSRDFPTPKGNSTNPNDWSPSWIKRTQIVYEPAQQAYYKGGYSGGAHAKLDEHSYDPGDPDADPPIPPTPATKTAIVNSAFQPFARTPEKRRLIEIWSFRWLRTIAPNTLLNAENKLNSAAFTITLPGLEARTWDAETALIDTIDISSRRWGLVSLVEINAEIIVDPDGWRWAILDSGTAARADAGDPDGEGGTISPGDLVAGKPRLRQLVDGSANPQPLQNPVPLDGNGQPLDPGDDPVFGQWLDLDTIDFATLPYIEDLV